VSVGDRDLREELQMLRNKLASCTVSFFHINSQIRKIYLFHTIYPYTCHHCIKQSSRVMLS